MEDASKDIHLFEAFFGVEYKTDRLARLPLDKMADRPGKTASAHWSKSTQTENFLLALKVQRWNPVK